MTLGSTEYPALANALPTGSLTLNLILRRYSLRSVGQCAPGVTPASKEVVPAGLMVVILMDSRTPSQSEYLWSHFLSSLYPESCHCLSSDHPLVSMNVAIP